MITSLTAKQQHQHPYGGGWVANTAVVSETVFDNALVSGNTLVVGNALSGNALVSGDAWVFDNARVSGNPRVVDALQSRGFTTEDGTGGTL